MPIKIKVHNRNIVSDRESNHTIKLDDFVDKEYNVLRVNITLPNDEVEEYIFFKYDLRNKTISFKYIGGKIQWRYDLIYYKKNGK